MLAINTGFITANLGLETKHGCFYRDIDAKSKHSENILKTIDELCNDAKIDVLDIGAIAVVVGPGSFTGLRIGTAIAKGLGCANKKLKFIAMSSLELMAYTIVKNSLNAEKQFYCVINALSDLFFVAKFDNKGIKIENEKMIQRDEFEAIGDQIFALKADIVGYKLNEIEFNSKDLLEFAQLKAENGEFVELEEMLPIYLRKSQAEDNLKKV